MTCILHLSDTHFGTEKPVVLDALAQLVAERRPDVLIYSGDITQRARRSEFQAARAFCDRLAIPQALALPGNHDLPLFNLAARLLRPYGEYLRAFGPTLEPVLDLPEALVIGVNTTRPRRHKNGEVSPQQVQQVAGRLAAAASGQLRIVVVHQPAVVLRAEDEHDRLRGADPALLAWSAAGADLVLGGHIHLPYVADLRQRTPPTPRRMWCVQAGTGVSSRVRHGTCNSVNLIDWKVPMAGEPRICTVMRYDYTHDARAFRQTDVRQLVLARS